MDILFSLIVSVFGGLLTSAFSKTMNESEHEQTASIDHLYWMDQADYADKIADQNAQDAYLRQVSFYKNFQSPNALYQQYKNLGASDQASLMAALGIGSPSMSAPMASSSAPGVGGSPSVGLGDVGGILSSLQNSINSFYENDKTAAETEQININNQWQSSLNAANVKKILNDIYINKGRLRLDQNIYRNVTIPTANSLISLNTQELKNKQAEWFRIVQGYENDRAKFYEIMSNAHKNEADAQYTSGALTDKTIAETGFIGQQTLTEEQNTLIKQYEARREFWNAQCSDLLGFDIKLPPFNQALNALTNEKYAFGHDVKYLYGKAHESFVKIKNGVDVAFKYGLQFTQKKDNAKRALHMAEKFSDEYFTGQSMWKRKKAKILEKANEFYDLSDF